MMNGYDHNNSGNKIDLTLKLGLPNSDHANQHLEFDQMNQHHACLDNDAFYSYEGINHYKTMNEGMNKANVGQVFNSNEVAWPPPNLMGSRSQYNHAHAHAQYMQSNYNGYGFSPFPRSSPMGSPPLSINYLHNINNNIINPNQHLQLGITASAGRRAAASMRRPREGTFNDPYKRCTNCNTNNTPMWRKGPLGHKTLCNACGIKYRKEEEKRMKVKGKEADKSNSHDSNAETA